MAGLLILPLVAFLSLLPLGLPFLRFFPFLNPLEKLVCSIGFSVVGLFLLQFSTFASGQAEFTLLIGLNLSLLSLGFCFQQLRLLAKAKEVRAALGGYLVFVTYCLLLVALVRNYSGGGWSSDWLEHYLRARVLAGQAEFSILDSFNTHFTSRPPLFNAVSAYMLQLSIGTFSSYQVIATILSSLIYFPAVLLMRTFNRNGRSPALLVAALLGLNPMVIQNSVYPWSKLLAAFFVLMAVYSYLRFREGNSDSWAALCFLWLAAASLTHYSGAPYLLWIGVLVLGEAFKEKWALTRIIRCFSGVVLMSPWFMWAIVQFGVGTTFGSNTAVVDAARFDLWGNLVKISSNILNSFVPFFLRGVDAGQFLSQQSALGAMRDSFFLVLQTNLIFGLGICAGPVVLAVIGARLCQGAHRQILRFWIVLLGPIVLLGLAVFGDLDLYGVAHICLQPIVILGTLYVGVLARSGATLARAALLAGAAFDFLVGIALTVWIEQDWIADCGLPFNGAAEWNCGRKVTNHLVFCGDLTTQITWFLWFGVAMTALLFLMRLAQECVARPTSN